MKWSVSLRFRVGLIRGGEVPPAAPGWSSPVQRAPRAAAIGAERVYLQMLDLADLDHLALIASDVVPQF